jgi:hypothetical protein
LELRHKNTKIVQGIGKNKIIILSLQDFNKQIPKKMDNKTTKFDGSQIVLYQPDAVLQLEVRVENETVWLSQMQMATLFQTTRNNITMHIGNVFAEKELEEKSVRKDSLHTASDGKKYKTKYYNLDVIISVGYRVKSQRGTQFRIWANQVLKDYLLKGYAINQRIERLEKHAIETNRRIEMHENKIDFFVKMALPPIEGIFYDGQIFDAYAFVADLIKSAKTSIVLIDNYVDESVLLLLSKRKKDVNATIYTAYISDQLNLDLKKHNAQYPTIEIKQFTKSHDRFLIIDDVVYHIGASLKDLGKKWFAFSKMEIKGAFIMTSLLLNK